MCLTVGSDRAMQGWKSGLEVTLGVQWNPSVVDSLGTW